MQNTDTQVRPRSWYQPLIIGGLVLVIALQLALLLRDPPPLEQVERVTPAPVAPVDNAWLVQLRLGEGASWMAVLTLLTEIDAQLVAGPSPLGLVHIAVARTGGPYTSAADALDWLRGQPIVVHAALAQVPPEYPTDPAAPDLTFPPEQVLGTEATQ